MSERREIGAAQLANVHRASRATLVAAFVMLGGVFVAFAAKATAVAFVFLVLMLVCAMASTAFAVIFRNRAVAAARAARSAQAARQRHQTGR
jgi:uncharacterized membrane protein